MAISIHIDGSINIFIYDRMNGEKEKNSLNDPTGSKRSRRTDLSLLLPNQIPLPRGFDDYDIMQVSANISRFA